MVAFLDEWILTLDDPIWSVRENAAIALGQAIQSEDIVTQITALELSFQHFYRTFLGSNGNKINGNKSNGGSNIDSLNPESQTTLGRELLANVGRGGKPAISFLPPAMLMSAEEKEKERQSRVSGSGSGSGSGGAGREGQGKERKAGKGPISSSSWSCCIDCASERSRYLVICMLYFIFPYCDILYIPFPFTFSAKIPL